MPREGDTIFALSTGSLPAAIAIVRISGPLAADTVIALAGKLPRPRYAALTRLRDEGGETLDRALILWFPGPESATGEDVVELHLHGGRAVVAAVLRRIGRIPGCRSAEPGEFTRRAFFNGRIDFAQAEGLRDLLAAETERQRRTAMRAAEGGLGWRVQGWRKRILSMSARIEADLEFGETEEIEPDTGHIQADAAILRSELEDVLARPPAERLRDGLRVVIAGPPNVGKSTLLNVLAGREAAIATPIAGTTRDVLDVPVDIDGIAVVLSDTAGLRSITDDPIERIGIERAGAAIDAADMILWLGSPEAIDHSANVLIVAARIDVEGPDPRHDIAVSARTGEGIDRLRAMIIARSEQLLPPEAGLTVNQRQREAIVAVHANLDLEGTSDPVLIAERLRWACDALDIITGRQHGVHAVLDALFGSFCIGK